MALTPATSSMTTGVPMTEPFCASSPAAQAMSDKEFWAKVYPDTSDDWVDTLAWDEFGPAPVGFCLRCGGTIYAEDYQQLRAIIDCDHEICDDCADEVTEYPDNDAWDEIKSIR